MQVCHISSVDRAYGNTTDFRVMLPKTYSHTTSLTLISADVPCSFPTVPAGTICLNNANTSISSGSYTVANLANTMIYAVQSTNPASNLTSISFDPIQNRFDFFSTTPNTSWPSGTFHRYCGLSTSVLTPSVASGTGWVLHGAGTPDLNPIRSVFISLKNLSPGFLSTSGTQGTFRVQIGNSMDVSRYNSGTSVLDRVTFPSTDISYLDVSITDESGNTLDRLGEWSFDIAFSQ